MRSGPKLLQGSVLALLGCALVDVRHAGAQQGREPEAGPDRPQRCITLSSIDHTEIIDDQTIAFFLTGGRVYLNHLDRACRNLDRNRPFSYETSTAQLCAIDTITVMEGFGGSTIPGDTCGLGEFVPSDEQAIEVLKGELEPVEVEPEEVEAETEAEARANEQGVGTAPDPAMAAAQEAVARDSQLYAHCLREADIDCIDAFMHWDLFGRFSGRSQTTLRPTILLGGPALSTSREMWLEVVRQSAGTLRMFEPAEPGVPMAGGDHLFSVVPYRSHRLDRGGVLHEQSSWMLGVSEDSGATWRFVNGGSFDSSELESMVPGFSETTVPASESSVIVAPPRERSEYLRTLEASFDIFEGAAVYQLTLDVRRVPEGVVEILVAFDDPAAPSRPLRGRAQLEPGQESLDIRSPMLAGFERGEIYEVVIYGSDPVTAADLFEHRQPMLFVPTQAQFELMTLAPAR